MNNNACVPQKLSKAMISLIIFLGAVALTISGLTILPVVGFVLAVPVALLSLYVLRLHLNERCEIEPT